MIFLYCLEIQKVDIHPYPHVHTCTQASCHNHCSPKKNARMHIQCQALLHIHMHSTDTTHTVHTLMIHCITQERTTRTLRHTQHSHWGTHNTDTEEHITQPQGNAQYRQRNTQHCHTSTHTWENGPRGRGTPRGTQHVRTGPSENTCTQGHHTARYNTTRNLSPTMLIQSPRTGS